MAVLRHRQFARFLWGNTIANVGQFLQALATPFLVKELTDSNAWVGAVSFANLIPALLLTPVAGNLADRLDRRRVLLTAVGIQMTGTAGFFFLHLFDALTPWRMFGLSVVMGVAGGLQWAPIQAMSAVLVPRRELAAAVRLVSISFTIGRSLGPALAGVVLATAGPGLAYFGTLAFSAVAVGFLISVLNSWEPADQLPSFVSQLRDGVRYVAVRPTIRLMLRISFTVASCAAAFGMPLAASVATDGFDAGGGGLGALTTMLGVGSILSSLYISFAADHARRSRTETGAIVLYVVGLFVVAATGYLVVGLLGFLLMGAAHMVHGVTLSTSLQLQLDEEYRGRVMSLWLMSLFGGLSLGSLAGGALADAYGIRTVIAGGAVVLLTVFVWSSVRTDGLAALDEDLFDDGELSGS